MQVSPMRWWMVVAVLALALGRPAAAQVAATEPVTEPAIAPAFEKRLTEELAARGIVLTRRQLGLLIEPRGDGCSVSLFELTTGRRVATTEIERLPANPDEAIALLIRAVVALEAAIAGQRPAEPPPVQPPSGLSPAQEAQLVRRRAAEILFRQYALRFTPSYDLGAATGRDRGNSWQAFRGRVDAELEPDAFYRIVGRDDLARAYERRHALMIGGFALNGVAFAAAAVLYYRGDNLDSCHVPLDQFDQCVRDRLRSPVPAVVAGVLGVVGGLFGAYFARNPHPIDENEAKTLADAYHQRLRGQLGLPIASEPLVREVSLAPYADGASRGLVLAGRF